MTGNLPIRLVAYPEDDARGNAVMRKVTVKYGCAFPTVGFEEKDVGGEQEIDAACELVLNGDVLSVRFVGPTSGDDLQRPRQRIAASGNRHHAHPPGHAAQ